MIVRLVLLLALTGVACRAAESAPGEVEPSAPRLEERPVSAAEQAEAAELLFRAQAAREAGEVAEARRLAERVVEEYPASSSAVEAVRLAAETALEQGDHDAAEAHAKRYAALFPPGSEAARAARRIAKRAGEARRAEREAVALIGVILPLSGSPYLEQYGELILEGIRLAEEDASAVAGPRPIELIVRDDGGDVERSAVVLQELEREGVVAVVGPLLEPAVRAAARARRDTTLVIVSPTASARSPLANVYSLNVGDTRGAELLADFAVRAALDSVATLYPRTPEFEREARAFARRVSRGGGTVVAAVPYDSGTTTFAEPLTRIARAWPKTLYVPAPARDVRQIAPQIGFYGLDTLGVQVLGGRAWASREVRRLVERRHLERVVASTPMYEEADAVRWSRFVASYERAYRRTLNNRFPALGYDAVRLVLEALPERRLDRSAVARRLAELEEVPGATGVLSVSEGELVRRPFLVQVRGDSLVAAPPPELFIPPPRPDSILVDSLGPPRSGSRRR